jgi:hypothetical protein
MKTSEVPQDAIKTLNGMKKALYAVDDRGEYTRTPTGGWESEEIVLTQVIDDFEAKVGGRRPVRRAKHRRQYFMNKMMGPDPRPSHGLTAGR